MPEIGHGIIMQRSDGGTPDPVWTSIGKITDPDYPSLTRDAVDATTTESANGYREFIGGLRDGGEVSPTLQLDTGDATFTALVADFNSDVAVTYRVLSPDAQPTASPPTGEAWTFTGLITSIEPETPLDDQNTVTVTFKVSGQPVLAAL